MNDDFRKSIFDIDIPTAAPSAGCLLVSEPFLHDDYFNHSVILLLDYEPGKEAMGLVLNRSDSSAVGDKRSIIEADGVEIPVYCGGPMDRSRLFFLHTLGDTIPNAKHIVNDLYVGGDFGKIMEYMHEGLPSKGILRFFLGYSGWGPGQLESEIENHVWAVTQPIDSGRLLTGRDNSYWHKIVRAMGEPYRGWLYHPMFRGCN